MNKIKLPQSLIVCEKLEISEKQNMKGIALRQESFKSVKHASKTEENRSSVSSK
jgi:hypothetical protein